MRARLTEVDMLHPQRHVHDVQECEETTSADSSSERSIATAGEESEQHDEANEQGVSTPTCCLVVVTAKNVTCSDVYDVRASVREPVPENAPHKTLPVYEEQIPDALLVSEHSSEPTTSCKNPMSITIEEAIGSRGIGAVAAGV